VCRCNINNTSVRSVSLIERIERQQQHSFLSRTGEENGMADEKDTPEMASIKSHIESWLDAHNNKIELDLTGDNIELQQHVSIGFTDAQANFCALNADWYTL
jgi:hypothetical protein